MRWLLLTLCLGCGDFVRYEEEPPAPLEGGGAEADERLAEATTLAHLELDGLLRRYVTVDGAQTWVDYAGLESPESRVVLDRYLATLAAVDPAQLADRDQRLAYWFNAYNASVLFGVIGNWGSDSAYSVENADFAFFRQRGHRFAGLDLSLDEIEHAIIRGDQNHAALSQSSQKSALEALHAALWDGEPVDARIHVALNCASLSCPNLLPNVWNPDTLDADLDIATRAFCADPAKGAGPNGLTPLFQWYQVDFDRVYGSPEAFVRAHRDDVSDVDFSTFLTYDWTLNTAP